MVSYLLSRKEIDVNYQGEYGYTALMDAVVSQDEKVVALLLQHDKIDVNIQNDDGQNALTIHRYGYYRNVKILDLLLKHNGKKLLMACASANATLAASILKHADNDVKFPHDCTNIDINFADARGFTSLMYGVRYNNKKIVALLLKRRDVDVTKMIPSVNFEEQLTKVKALLYKSQRVNGLNLFLSFLNCRFPSVLRNSK